MMGVFSTQIIDVQRNPGMVDQTLEKFTYKVQIKTAGCCADKGYMKFQIRSS